jgi:hypothetical protein
MSIFFNVDGGCSQIYSSGTSQGAHRRRFLVLMVGALGSPALTPPRGAAIDVFNVDGGHSCIYRFDTSQGATIDVS